MSDQGAEYAKFIESQLKNEYDRRDTVNLRAGSAVTSATALVTVTLLVVAALKGKDFSIHGAPLATLSVAFLALLLSAALAVLSGMNWKFPVTSVQTMKDMATTHWQDSEITARGISAFCNIQTINSVRAGTNVKYRLLLGAAISQLLAILGLGASVLLIISG